MQPLKTLGNLLLRTLREHVRPLIAFHLFFTLLASSLLLPGMAWALQRIFAQLNSSVVTTDALLALLFSPAGLLIALPVLASAFILLYWQQAGMLQVAVRPRANHYRLAFEALWLSTRRLPALSGLVILQVGAHLLLVSPFMLALTWLYDLWLGGLDTYYIQIVRPASLWYFIACALPVTGGWAWLASWLYLRWVLALPLVALEKEMPLRALKRSVKLTRGWHRSIGFAVLAVLIGIILLPILSTWMFDHVFTPLLEWLPEHNTLLIPATLAYLTAYVLLTLGITFLGIAINAMLSASLYIQLAKTSLQETLPTASHPGRLAWAVELSVVLFAALQAWWVINSFELQDDVDIIAHRGSSMVAPENTLSAIRQALADGANSVEIDVQLTSDQHVMLYHDTSLQRLTGLPRNFTELTREELSQLDVGNWFGAEHRGERIPTLADALRTVRGSASLMIELKPEFGHERTLANAVLRVLEEENHQRLICWAEQTNHIHAYATCGFPDVFAEMRIAVMTPSLLRYIESAAPQLRTTLLAQLIMPGTLNRRDFDALGLRHNRITPNEIRLARLYGYEVHAWTVNSPARMSTLIDMGVDGIITDYPQQLAQLMDERRELSDGGLILVKLRNWLRQ
ncbi:glycerophosphodiester phosphodiesterase family protein [Vreelandella aquamarina]